MSLLVLCASTTAQQVEIVNNQPFPIRMPWRLLEGPRFIIDVAANGKQSIDASHTAPMVGKVLLRPTATGIELLTSNQKLGAFDWDVIVDKIDKKASDEDAAKTKRDYDTTFSPLPLKFVLVDANDLLQTWSAEAEKSGVKLHVEVDSYAAGFVDLRCTFENESAPTTKVYAAVVTRWQRPAGATSTVDYDNHIAPLPAGGATPFRAARINICSSSAASIGSTPRSAVIPSPG